MDLTQARIVAADVAGLASFYAMVIGVEIVANDYYVEVPAAFIQLKPGATVTGKEIIDSAPQDHHHALVTVGYATRCVVL